MFLELGHTKLKVFEVVQDIIEECYSIVSKLPSDERFNLIQQIKRAAISIKLNLAEGSSRRSGIERKRYYEIARGSLIEIDTAIGVCINLKLIPIEYVQKLGQLIVHCYGMLTGIINNPGK